MNKEELRREMRRAVESSDPTALKIEDREITSKLLDVLSGFGCVFIYVSSKDEIPTEDVIRVLLSSGVRVCVPKTFENSLMDAVEIKSLNELVKGRYGILEPCGKDAVCPDEISAVVVPGLAFGRDFTRLGKGKGYYDRFLKRAKNAVRIAPCRKACLRDSVPHDEHDERVDIIITEDEILKDR